MSDNQLEVQKPVESSQVILRPVVKAKDLIEAHKEVSVLIRDALEYGVDYGMIPGTKGNPSLLKPGAERLIKAFGCTARYELISAEVDHNLETKWSNNYGKSGTAVGVYRYLYRCIIEKNGVFIGDGQGSCSTLESKYQSRPRDMENTVVKMSQKRALIAATLNAFGLSNRFTQDVEDTVVVEPTVEIFDKKNPKHLDDLEKILEKQKVETRLHDYICNEMHGKPKVVATLTEIIRAAEADPTIGVFE